MIVTVTVYIMLNNEKSCKDISQLNMQMIKSKTSLLLNFSGKLIAIEPPMFRLDALAILKFVKSDSTVG